MMIATVVVSALLSAGLVASAMGKFTKSAQVVENLTRVGVPLKSFPLLGIIEVLGALGLMIGLAIGPLGVAAAVGVCLYFIGAMVVHLTHGDKNIGPAAMFLGLSAAALALHGATL